MIAFSKLALGGRFGPARTLTDQARIFERGDAATHTWFLEHGAVEIVQSGDAGAEVVVKILVGPTLFGTIEALGDEPHYLESVRCLGAIRGYRMAREDFVRALAGDASLGLECAADMSRAFCVAARFEANRMYDADVLLANLLVAYAEIFGERAAGGMRLRIKRTQGELAGAIGASERQVNRLIIDWRADGRLTKSAGFYTIADLPYFAERAMPLTGSLVHGLTRRQNLALAKIA